MLSDQYELQILRYIRYAPAAAGWHRPGDVAEAVGLELWRVHSILGALWRRHLIDRGSYRDGHFGEVSITERGLLELAAADQLRLVT